LFRRSADLDVARNAALVLGVVKVQGATLVDAKTPGGAHSNAAIVGWMKGAYELLTLEKFP